MAKITKKELANLCQHKIDDALNRDGDELSGVRQDLLSYYRGDLYGDEREGYSQFVTREVFESLEWARPHILRTFLSSDKPVEFVPFGPEDVPLAAQETDTVNYVINRTHFAALNDWFSNTLLYPTAYAKVLVEKKRRVEEEYYEGLPQDELTTLLDDPDVEVISEESRTIMLDPFASDPMGVVRRLVDAQNSPQPQPVQIFDVQIQRSVEETCVGFAALPPEEVLVDSYHAELNLDSAPFVCHRTAKSISDLIEQGYDESTVLRASKGTNAFEWQTERTHRLQYTDQDPQSSPEEAPGMTMVTVDECYIRVDWDNDGFAELRKVVKVDDVILENEPCSLMPIVAMATTPMPNDHVGYSLAQSTKDLQRLSSALTRQMLDNAYSQNVRRKYVNERMFGALALDIMSNPQSEVIPVDGDPRAAVFPEQSQSMLQELLPIIAHVDEKRKLRTGIAPEVSLNPEVLQSATASAFSAATDQASARIEMIVRIFAETGIKHLFLKLHQALRMYRDIPLVMEIRGEVVTSDPSSWRTRANVQINVGVGFNSRQQKVDMLMQVLGIQEKAAALGLVTPQKAYRALTKLIDAAGIGHASEFFANPDEPGWQPPQPPPDPNMLVAQAEMMKVQQTGQLEMQKLQAELQREQMRAQAEALKLEAERERATSEVQMRAAELMMKARQADVEVKLRTRDMGLQEAMAKVEALLKQQQAVKTRAEAEAIGVELSDIVREAQEVIRAADMALAEGPDNGDGE